MNIFSEVEKLNLTKEDFVVLGSGILSALGIRDAEDIDLLVRPQLFEKLKNEGWQYEVIEIEGKPRDMLSKGNAQVFKDFWWKDKILSPEEGIAKAQTIKGINFISLQILLKYKKSSNREKDAKDVVLIEEYLKTHSV